MTTYSYEMKILNHDPEHGFLVQFVPTNDKLVARSVWIQVDRNISDQTEILQILHTYAPHDNWAEQERLYSLDHQTRNNLVGTAHAYHADVAVQTRPKRARRKTE